MCNHRSSSVVEIRQLQFARGYPGYVWCHRLAADHIAALFAAWERADLFHLIVRYEGCCSRLVALRGRCAAGDSCLAQDGSGAS